MSRPTPAWVADVLGGLPGMLTYQDVANVLRCSPRTVRRLVDAGSLVAKKNAKAVLVPRAELGRYLENMGAA